MPEEQAAILAEAWAGRAPDLPLRSPEELLTLASIVEKETASPRSGGWWLGLRQPAAPGMRLQTDPAVIYGITEGRAPLGRGCGRASWRP